MRRWILDNIGKRANFAPDALAVLLVAVAFYIAYRTTAGLTWPSESDFLRDMGAAQALLDGAYWSDSAYLGEIRWYNPLVPSLAAILSLIFQQDLPIVYARAGTFLNLLGPISFYVLLRSLLRADGRQAQTGRAAAVAGLAAYLFLGSTSQPSWTHATYSPWLWPLNFAQGLAYTTLALYFVSSRKQHPLPWNLATGVLLGLTILAHTAPGLIVTLVILGTCLNTAVRDPSQRHSSLLRLAAIGTTATAVASPFLGPLLLEYRFAFKNPAPSNFVGIELSEIAKGMLSIRAVIALLGIGLLTQRRARREFATNGLRDGLSIALAVLALLAYGLTSQLIEGRVESFSLPLVVPTFHFHLYYKAVESAFFGIAIALVLRLLLDRTSRALWYGLVSSALVATIVLVSLPSYRGRHDLTFYASEAKTFASTPAVTELYEWLVRNTKPEDVVLGRNRPSLVAVAAGRKVVAIGPAYSNPYVEWTARRRDQLAMLEAFRSGAFGRLDSLATRYHVKYVLLGDLVHEPCCDWSRTPEADQPIPRFTTSDGQLRVFELPAH